MKRILVLALISLLLFSACAKEVSEAESTPDDDGIILPIDSEESTPETDGKYSGDSDGVIPPMSAEELIEKLSMLNENTTMDDVVEIFGKEPYMLADLNSNAWNYFSGDVVISLSGISLHGGSLYRAVVAYGDSIICIIGQKYTLKGELED